ncbi:Integrase core domain [Popillia japonica]|uniref:Integrase core domain n=1 Tax=Popillia japonica TaxID=7064 RepID=A0AAW1MXU3_POPJA
MLSIKKDVVNELHAPARRKFPTRRVIIKGLEDLYQIDLIEMIPYAKENDGYTYIFVCINCFSKYAWAIPLKNKKATTVSEAMENILSRNSKKIPRNIQSYQGKEFYNNFGNVMKKYGINHYNSTYSIQKSSIAERFNRTLKNMLWKDFSYNGNYRWISILPNILHRYNNTVHRTTSYKPSKVYARNAKIILRTVYSKVKIMDPKKPKLQVGDHVRISKFRQIFSKTYTPNWSNEIFTVSKIQNTYPRTYAIQDAQGKTILGGFYELELKKVRYPDVYLVEKVLRRRKDKVLVKWLGMDTSHNSWISKDNVL